MSDDGLFTTYERLNTCRRTEVTVDNLHLLAQHFGATAVYTTNPRLIIPPVNEGGAERVAEVGSWIDERGSRWSPEPLARDGPRRAHSCGRRSALSAGATSAA